MITWRISAKYVTISMTVLCTNKLLFVSADELFEIVSNH